MQQLILLLLLLTGAVSLAAQPSSPAVQKLNYAIAAANALYVDRVDEPKMVEEAIKCMLKTLDPHSTYADAEEVREMTEPLQGNFEGIGIQFNTFNDTLLIVQAISGGPSERVGLLAGDRMIAIEGQPIAGVKMKDKEIMKKLKGPKGTQVRVEILRHGVTGSLFFTITRDKIPVYSLDASYMHNKETGYVRISRFAATTHQEFVKALATLKQQGAKSLIIDLSGNGGGYLNAATDIAQEILTQRDLIVYTEGRKSPRDMIYATAKGMFPGGKVVVMVDEYSASASEILAGALQDQDRGVIVGRRTFGKGLVQRPIPLNDGSMIRLTIARYYTPAGRCIQKPYTIGDEEEYRNDLTTRFKHGELLHADSIHFADSLRCYTLRNKRTIFGGGGIMPDVFIPLDTARYSLYQRKIFGKGTLYKYTLGYVNDHRSELKREYKDVDSFLSHWQTTPSLLQGIRTAAEKDSITCTDAEWEADLPLLTAHLRALVARDLFDLTAYYRAINPTNDIYKAAVEIISDDPRYKTLLLPQR